MVLRSVKGKSKEAFMYTQHLRITLFMIFLSACGGPTSHTITEITPTQVTPFSHPGQLPPEIISHSFVASSLTPRFCHCNVFIKLVFQITSPVSRHGSNVQRPVFKVHGCTALAFSLGNKGVPQFVATE